MFTKQSTTHAARVMHMVNDVTTVAHRQIRRCLVWGAGRGWRQWS